MRTNQQDKHQNDLVQFLCKKASRFASQYRSTYLQSSYYIQLTKLILQWFEIKNGRCRLSYEAQSWITDQSCSILWVKILLKNSLFLWWTCKVLFIKGPFTRCDFWVWLSFFYIAWNGLYGCQWYMFHTVRLRVN